MEQLERLACSPLLLLARHRKNLLVAVLPSHLGMCRCEMHVHVLNNDIVGLAFNALATRTIDNLHDASDRHALCATGQTTGATLMPGPHNGVARRRTPRPTTRSDAQLRAVATRELRHSGSRGAPVGLGGGAGPSGGDPVFGLGQGRSWGGRCDDGGGVFDGWSSEHVAGDAPARIVFGDLCGDFLWRADQSEWAAEGRGWG
jgi:hypothetical protein